MHGDWRLGFSRRWESLVISFNISMKATWGNTTNTVIKNVPSCLFIAQLIYVTAIKGTWLDSCIVHTICADVVIVIKIQRGTKRISYSILEEFFSSHFSHCCDVSANSAIRSLLSLYSLEQAVSVTVGRRSGGQLATMLVATISVIICFLYFSSRFSPQLPTFLIGEMLQSKKLV